ncbi:MAG TPA: response regulator transcription factor [Candidatus Janibacter merdipullorum]|nr:response regulator transcription factor [Candidatus Janibacter merdipullorum]
MLDAEPDFELVTPAATLQEVMTTPGVDVVVLAGDLDDGGGPTALLAAAGAQPGASPAWVVLVEDVTLTESVIAAGAHGCLAGSSTPLQIGAAIRAAARGDHADLDQPVTGPLVQRVHREAPPLTEREVEVLRLVGAGLGNQQIAEVLYLSLSSVKSHLSHTYGRLGVTRRDAAVAEARRQGLI